MFKHDDSAEDAIKLFFGTPTAPKKVRETKLTELGASIVACCRRIAFYK